MGTLLCIILIGMVTTLALSSSSTMEQTPPSETRSLILSLGPSHLTPLSLSSRTASRMARPHSMSQKSFLCERRFIMKSSSAMWSVLLLENLLTSLSLSLAPLSVSRSTSKQSVSLPSSLSPFLSLSLSLPSSLCLSICLSLCLSLSASLSVSPFFSHQILFLL
jgi:hypothetical protein